MKKIISLIISGILLSSIFNISVAADNWEPSEYVCDTVYGLEIIDEYYNLRKNVTRAEFTEIAIRLKRIKEVTDQGPIFYDVAMTDKFYATINTAALYGLVYGYEDGKFYPSREITTDEAVKICERILCPNEEFLEKYETIATSESLYKGLPANNTLTYAAAIQLVYNVLNAGHYAFDIGNEAYFYNNSFMLDYWDMTEITGQVTANEYTGLTGIEGVREGCLKIDDTEYLSEKADISSWLGYKVKAYVRYDEETDESSIISITKSSKTDDLVVKAIDILDETTLNKLVYVNEEGRIKTAVLAAPDFIYNGVHYADYTIEELNIDNGQLTLIDSNNDGKYDIVKSEEYRNVFVSAIDIQDKMIYDYYGNSPVDLNNKNYVILNSNGGEIDISGLLKNNVVSIFESKTGREKCVKIVVSGYEPVGGVVKSLKPDDDFTKINIDGEEYLLDKKYNERREENARKIPAISVGSIIVAYRDYEGIIYAVTKDSNSLKYGYMTKLRKVEDDTTGEEIVRVKIFTEDGEFIDVYTNKKIKINGIREESKNLVDNHMNLYKDGKVNPQLIRFKLNKSNLISEFEYAPTALVDKPHLSEIHTLVKNDYIATSAVFRSGSKLSSKWIVTSGTIIFAIPDDLDEEDEFGFRTGFEIDKHMDFPISVFNASPNYVADAIVTETALTIGYHNEKNFVLVTDIEEALNFDDEPTICIAGIKQGKEFEAYTTESAVATGVDKGDIVQIVLNDKGEIKGMRVIFKNSITPENPDSKIIYKDQYAYKCRDDRYGPNYTGYANLVCVYGRCLGKEDNVITISGYDRNNSVYATGFSTPTVYVYDTKSLTVTTATFDAVAESTSASNLNGSVVLSNVRNDLGAELWIIK